MFDFDFALVDPVQRSKLPESLDCQSLALTEVAEGVDLFPGLLDLRALSQNQRDALMTCADAQPRLEPLLCALLRCDQKVSGIVTHLRQAQVIRGPQGAKAWLRIHDPRVWLHLPRVLNPDLLHAITGPIVQWWVNWRGNWSDGTPARAISTPRRRNLTDTEWAKLARIGAVNRSLAHLGYWGAEALRQNAPAVDALVERGQQRYQLSRMDDLVGYVELAWRHGAAFDDHPLARQVIADYSDEAGSADIPDASVVDALAAMSEADWQTIDNETGGRTDNR